MLSCCAFCSIEVSGVPLYLLYVILEFVQRFGWSPSSADHSSGADKRNVKRITCGHDSDGESCGRTAHIVHSTCICRVYLQTHNHARDI